MKVFYRPGKTHLVPDALSRLIDESAAPPEADPEILGPVNVFAVTVVELSDEIKSRIKRALSRRQSLEAERHHIPYDHRHQDLIHQAHRLPPTAPGSQSTSATSP
ncbi:retrotransposable element tf2 [Diplodia corticola]|uniref:Retrotransposable element tf2 n=1 Tax=Diplodia corticola TaxID=236234 RepID=A0A1J9S5Z2_9PEZI|nr:retrotransposable element tf2 [Diplodia corticola]OJD35372.1 retrotransposable element tf2 [Diplodia corticola]